MAIDYHLQRRLNRNIEIENNAIHHSVEMECSRDKFHRTNSEMKTALFVEKRFFGESKFLPLMTSHSETDSD